MSVGRSAKRIARARSLTLIRASSELSLVSQRATATRSNGGRWRMERMWREWARSRERQTGDREPMVDAERPEFYPVRPGTFPSNERVSRLIAASGAFPLALAAYPVSFDADHHFWEAGLLADGGLADNSGVDFLLSAHILSTRHADLQDWRLDLALASDASEIFGRYYAAPENSDPEINQKMRHAADVVTGFPFALQYISEPLRAIDITYANSGAVPFFCDEIPPLVQLSPQNLFVAPYDGRHSLSIAPIVETAKGDALSLLAELASTSNAINSTK